MNKKKSDKNFFISKNTNKKSNFLSPTNFSSNIFKKKKNISRNSEEKIVKKNRSKLLNKAYSPNYLSLNSKKSNKVKEISFEKSKIDHLIFNSLQKKKGSISLSIY